MRSAAPLALALVFAVSACASPEPGSGLRLVETKAQAQLLRNAAAARVPEAAIASVANAGDASSECGDGDPYRRWDSTIELALTAESAPGIRDIYLELISSYVTDGWVSGRPQDDSTRLVNTGSYSEVLVAIVSDDLLRVTVSGPCVLTDGAGSDEVKLLESER